MRLPNIEDLDVGQVRLAIIAAGLGDATVSGVVDDSGERTGFDITFLGPDGEPVRDPSKAKVMAALDAHMVQVTKVEAKQEVRRRIRREAGDTETLLGTTADVAGLALYVLAQLARAMRDHADDPAALKAAMEASPFMPLADMLVTRVEAGTVRIPALAKGMDVVVGEILDRSTKVADVLAPPAGQP